MIFSSVLMLMLPHFDVDKCSLYLSQVIAGIDEPEVRENQAKIEKVVGKIRQDRFPFLDHPGKIHYLYQRIEDVPDQNSFLVVKQESSTFAHDLLILERMVLDHLQPYYTAALKGAKVN